MLCSPPKQDSKDGAIEEEEKQAENGKKEEERGREPEGEREADKTESDMGMKVHIVSLRHKKYCVPVKELVFFY